MKEILPWLVRWACRAGTRDFCSALGRSGRPSINNFSSPYGNSICLSPYRLASWQAVVLGRLSLIMCLWPLHRKRKYIERYPGCILPSYYSSSKKDFQISFDACSNLQIASLGKYSLQKGPAVLPVVLTTATGKRTYTVNTESKRGILEQI
jgi:hypothetical protein